MTSRPVGNETLRGVPTTHYRGTVDAIDAPVDVWVDGDGRTHKVAATVERAAIKVASEIEYYDFGAELDIRNHHPGQVLDFRTSSATGAHRRTRATQTV